MAQDNNAAQQIFDTIVTRDLDPKALDAMGKPTVNAADADLISFNFKTENKDYGTVVVLIDGEEKIELYYGDSIGRTMERDDRGDWYDFLAVIRNIAKRNLYTFGLNNMNRLKYSMKSMAKLAEGWNGTNKTSYNKQGPAKLIIKHSRKLGEGEARFRNIESLFVENSQGERFKMPFRSISGGKAMARHVSEGGNPYDTIGQHISDTISEIATLGRFIRASKSKSFGQNADALNIAEDAVRHYKDLKRKAKKMISRRGYKDIFASWDPMEITELDETIDQVREVFSKNTIDSRIEEALPILAKIKETSMKEADVFEQWADSITEGTWALPDTPEQMAELAELMKEPLHCGPAGEFATEQLYGLIGDDELFDDIYEMGLENPDADCRPLVLARLKEFNIELGENAPMTSIRPQSRTLSNLGGTREIAPNGEPTGSTRGFKPLGEDEQLNEIAPAAVAAAVWVIKWCIRFGAWPVIKWLLKKHGGKLFGGAAIAYYIDEGWDWVKSAIGEEYAQMLIDNKFEIGMAVAFIVGAVALKKLVEKQGEKLVSANDTMNEDQASTYDAAYAAKEPAVERIGEEVEQMDEISRSMTPMKNKFGGRVDPKKFDAYKKYMKKNSLDEPTVRMIADDPDAGESKQMMNNPKYKEAMKLYRAAHIKEEVELTEDPTQEEPLTKANQQDLDDEDMTEVTDIDTGKPALKAERDPMIESELDRLLTLARG